MRFYTEQDIINCYGLHRLGDPSTIRDYDFSYILALQAHMNQQFLLLGASSRGITAKKCKLVGISYDRITILSKKIIMLLSDTGLIAISPKDANNNLILVPGQVAGVRSPVEWEQAQYDTDDVTEYEL